MEQTQNTPDAVDTMAARLEDRFRIEQVLRRWARAVDRRDWALVRTVFHPGAVDDHGMYKGDVDGLIDWLEARHQCITMSMHVLGNVYIEFSGAQAALCESYVVAYQRYDAPPGADQAHIRAALGDNVAPSDLPLDVMMPARYIDAFEQRGGAWRISRRTTVFEGRYFLQGDNAALDPAWTVGQRDGSDPLYIARRSAGLPA
jgi:hypothetical protein